MASIAIGGGFFNMDQTPLPFSFQSSKMPVKHGLTTIHVQEMTDGMKWATLALTVMADGDFLTPMVIFKGMW